MPLSSTKEVKVASESVPFYVRYQLPLSNFNGRLDIKQGILHKPFPYRSATIEEPIPILQLVLNALYIFVWLVLYKASILFMVMRWDWF